MMQFLKKVSQAYTDCCPFSSLKRFLSNDGLTYCLLGSFINTIVIFCSLINIVIVLLPIVSHALIIGMNATYIWGFNVETSNNCGRFSKLEQDSQVKHSGKYLEYFAKWS